MENTFDILLWDDIKGKLKLKYPHLTNADLQWRNNSRDDLIEMIADKLMVPFNVLRLEIDTM
jgi:hypothetical protein